MYKVWHTYFSHTRGLVPKKRFHHWLALHSTCQGTESQRFNRCTCDTMMQQYLAMQKFKEGYGYWALCLNFEMCENSTFRVSMLPNNT